MNVYADRLVKACRASERAWDAEDMARVPRPPNSRHGTWLLIDVAPVSYVCANDVRTAGGVLGTPEHVLVGQILAALGTVFRALEEDVNPCATVLFTEAPAGKLSRRAFYPNYKVKREERRADPDETEAMIDRVRRIAIKPEHLMSCFGCSYGLVDSENVEADDALASVALGVSAAGCRTVIATNDRDIWQCCRWANVSVIDTGRHLHVRDREINDAFGSAANIPLYKAIAGCTSDNIAGAKGVGDKTVRLLLDGHDIGPRMEGLLKASEGEIWNALMATHLPLVGTSGNYPADLLNFELQAVPF